MPCVLQDVFLVAIERNGRTLHAVAPTEVLHDGDVLWFAGSPDGVISLRKVPGARPRQHPLCKRSILRTQSA